VDEPFTKTPSLLWRTTLTHSLNSIILHFYIYL